MLTCKSVPLIRRLSVNPIYQMLVCNAYIWAFLCAYICAFVRKWSYTGESNASIRDKKTHVYRVAGMIASIRGKKPYVYRVIILKQMADHKLKRQNNSDIQITVYYHPCNQNTDNHFGPLKQEEIRKLTLVIVSKLFLANRLIPSCLF